MLTNLSKKELEQYIERISPVLGPDEPLYAVIRPARWIVAGGLFVTDRRFLVLKGDKVVASIPICFIKRVSINTYELPKSLRDVIPESFSDLTVEAITLTGVYKERFGSIPTELAKLLAEYLQSDLLKRLELLGQKVPPAQQDTWEYMIISGPVLAGQELLVEQLNRLGLEGWELVDTQRHSIGGKQVAVCFLKRKRLVFGKERKENVEEANENP